MNGQKGCVVRCKYMLDLSEIELLEVGEPPVVWRADRRIGRSDRLGMVAGSGWAENFRHFWPVGSDLAGTEP